METPAKSTIERAADQFRGVTADEALGDRTDAAAVRADVRELNANPETGDDLPADADE